MSSVRPLVIIPTYQEAPNIETVLGRALAALPEGHVLVVDDGSPDGTADLAERIGTETGRVSVLRRAKKSGLGNAYRAGFAWGIEHGHEVLVEMDGDLSHDPAVLPDLVAAVSSDGDGGTGAGDGAGLAIGSRYVPGGDTPHWPTRRRLLSLWGNRYVGFVLGLKVRDATAGFRAYRAETLAAIDYATTTADGYGFQVEMTYRVAQVGRPIAEVPIVFTDRVRGTSKMSGRIVVEAMWLVTLWGIRYRILRRRPAWRKTAA